MLSWRGCVQGSGLISKYSNLLINGQKFRKKYSKNGSNIPCYHDIEGAVFMVQGPHLKIEQGQNISKYRKCYCIMNMITSPD
jgi:hypothetical protein